MESLVPLVTPALGFAGVMLGAFLVYRLNHRLEERKGRIAARNVAYFDFLTSVVDALAAQQAEDDVALKAAYVRNFAARIRVGLHASPAVVNAVIDFVTLPEGAAAGLTNDTFLVVYEKMREDGLDAAPEPVRLRALLFGAQRIAREAGE